MDRVAMNTYRFVGMARSWLVAGLFALVACVLPSLPAHAAPVAMTDIGFNALPSGKFEIRMQFDGTPPSPQGYTIDKPARIALDLPGVASKLAQKKHTLAFDNAQSVVVVESGGRTRVRHRGADWDARLAPGAAADPRPGTYRILAVDGNCLVIEAA